MAMNFPEASYELNPDNPWPGLAWYDEKSEQFFKGREQEIRELQRLVTDAPLTVLFGRSGLGKTSLIKAGLFPALRRASCLPVYIRINFASRTVGAQPLIEQLFDAFTQACDSAEAEPTPARQPDDSLWEYLHRTGTRVWSSHNEPLLPVFVLDQFEEVFTLGAADPQAVSQLRQDLADLAENRIPVRTEQRIAAHPDDASGFALRGLQYRVLLSFREDFATSFERWPELPSLLRNRLQLLPMTGTQALEAVHGPAAHMLDPSTAERIVRVVAAEKHQGADDVSAPLAALQVEPAILSVVCRGLNAARQERRGRGGADCIDAELVAATSSGVIDRHYDTCMQDQAVRVHRFVENELVTEGGFRNQCAQDDAAREPYGVDLSALQVLVDRRLLRFEPSHGITRVELIHDVLARTVVKQRDARRRADQQAEHEQRLRQEAEAVRAELQKQEDARRAEAAARLAEEGRRRAVRRLRLVGATAALAVAIAIGVTMLYLYARRQETEASQQTRIAIAERQHALDLTKIARSRELASAAIVRLELDPELAARLAIEADAVRQTDQAVSALRQALFRWRHRTGGGSSQKSGQGSMLPMRTLIGHRADVQGVAFSPDGRRLLSVGCGTTARLWNVERGATISVLQHRASQAAGAFSRDGRTMLTAGGPPCLLHPVGDEPKDSDLRLWDAETGTLRSTLSGSPDQLVGAAFDASEHGDEVAAGGVAGTVLTWTVASGKMRVIGKQMRPDDIRPGGADMLGTELGIQAVEYSPDGLQLATGGLGGTVVIWDPITGRRRTTLTHDARVLALAYGGTTTANMSLVSVDESGVVKLWDASNPDAFKLRREIRSYGGSLYSTALSRDGRFLVTVSGKELSVWETSTGARLLQVTPGWELYAVAMTGDGRTIAAGGADGFLALFDCEVCVSIDDLRTLVAQQPPRALSDQERRDLLGVEP